MEIIGLLGHQGVGKNYIAEVILPKVLKKKNTVVLAMADHFKVDSICKHNLEYDKVFGEKDYYTRKKLQQIGTEEGRDKYGENIWVNILATWIKTLYNRGTERFIITDLRFQNEVNWCKSMGGKVIKICAPKRFMERVEKESLQNSSNKESIINHPSESGIDKIQNYDFMVNNDIGYDIENQISELFN